MKVVLRFPIVIAIITAKYGTEPLAGGNIGRFNRYPLVIFILYWSVRDEKLGRLNFCISQTSVGNSSICQPDQPAVEYVFTPKQFLLKLRYYSGIMDIPTLSVCIIYIIQLAGLNKFLVVPTAWSGCHITKKNCWDFLFIPPSCDVRQIFSLKPSIQIVSRAAQVKARRIIPLQYCNSHRSFPI